MNLPVNLIHASGACLTIFLIFFLSNPAYAKTYTRSCTASYYINPTSIPSGGRRLVLHRFTGKGKIGYYNPNKARRRARKNLDECVRAHWRNRHASNMPSECTESNLIYNYPYNSLEAELGHQICTANRGYDHIIASIGVSYRGKKGCDGETRGILDPWGIELDSNMRFACNHP